MTQHETDMVKYEPVEMTPYEPLPYGAADVPEEGDANPFLKVHKLLAGRYKYALTLAVLLAAIGGYIAYNYQPPMYRSTGVIRIRPYVPKVIYNSDQSGVMPMFEAFAAWQAELMRSQRVVNMALESDTWQETGQGMTPDDKAKFHKNLNVGREPEAHLIYVSYADENPHIAAAGTQAIINAYMRSYGESDVERDSRRLRVLEERRATLNSELASLRKRILSLGNQYGSDALEDNYRFKLERLHELEKAYKETQIALATAEAELVAYRGNEDEAESLVPEQGEGDTDDDITIVSEDNPLQLDSDGADGESTSPDGGVEVADGLKASADEGSTAESETTSAGQAAELPSVDDGDLESGETLSKTQLADLPMQANEMTLEEIAVLDPKLRQMMDQKEAMQRDMSGLTARHPARIEAEEDLAELNRMIETRAQAVRTVRMAAEVPEVEEDGENPLELRIAGLEERERRLEQLFKESKAETMELGRTMLQIGNLRTEADSVKRRLDETNFRMEELSVESSANRRIEVVSTGEVPMIPSNDNRRKQLGVLGGLGSAMCGFGLVLAVGLIDPRLRRSDDRLLEDKGVRLLGMVPQLNDDVENADDATTAAHCVHQIRNLMQIKAQRNGHKIFTITSPVPGTGKSSLTLSLGLSFAAANNRTLIIDSDFAGCGLSRRIACINHHRIADVLRERGMVTPEQIKDAHAAAAVSGRQLTTELVSAGHLSADELDEAMNLRQRMRTALVDSGLIAAKKFDRLANKVGSSNDRLRTELVRRRIISRADIDQALDFPEFQGMGMIDALTGAPLDDCVSETGIPNLWMISAGDAEAHDMNQIAPPDIRRIFREARGKFDYVLIDTGPLGGDVGTAILATEADGALLILSRMEGRRQAEQALEALEEINARVEGVIFNRADMSDLERSTNSGVSALSGASAVSGRSRRPDHENDYRDFYRQQSEKGVGKRAVGFGPVARSVVCTGAMRRKPRRDYNRSLDAKALPTAS